MGRKAGGRAEALFGAAVPLERAIDPGRERMIAELEEIVGAVGARVLVEEEGGGKPRGFLGGLLKRGTELRCRMAGINLVIRVCSGPFCKPSMVPAFVNPAVWGGSLKPLAEHRGHILIAEADARAGTNADALFDRATAVTLAAAAMAALSDPLGVVWLPARNTVPIRLFGAEMERLTEGLAPLRFWLRWRILPPPVREERELGELSGKALNPGVATVGMSAFLGAELVAPPSTAEQDEMLEQVFALASAIIDEKWQIRDRGVFAGGEGPPLRVAWRESGEWSFAPYWELVPRPTAARAPKPEPGAVQKPAEPPAKAEESEDQFTRRLRLVVRGE